MTANVEGDAYLCDPQQQAKWRRALQGASLMAPTNIPQRCDVAVMAKIAQKAAQIQRRRLWKRLAYSGAAATILMVLSLAVVVVIARPGNSSPDIVDAYLLALKIESGQQISRQDDFNKDGQVNFSDVEAMARQAVSISSGTIDKGG